jgi:hypothetical protein
MYSSDWSNGIRIRYHIIDTRPDTEFKVELEKGLAVELERWGTFMIYSTLLSGGGGAQVVGAYTRPLTAQCKQILWDRLGA